ncbi:hypothetical protein [Streptomyces coeruleorubidus]|uniref:hypothetical protein n=1 Tax=Streptomyces coeruleorubidus TaxID=116188 RepID=UPI0033BB29FA
MRNPAIAGAFRAVLVAWDLVGTLMLPLGVAGREGLRLVREAAWTRSGKDTV